MIMAKKIIIVTIILKKPKIGVKLKAPTIEAMISPVPPPTNKLKKIKGEAMVAVIKFTTIDPTAPSQEFPPAVWIRKCLSSVMSPPTLRTLIAIAVAMVDKSIRKPTMA